MPILKKLVWYNANVVSNVLIDSARIFGFKGWQWLRKMHETVHAKYEAQVEVGI